MLPVIKEEACPPGGPGMSGAGAQGDEHDALALYRTLRAKGTATALAEVRADARLDEARAAAGWERLLALGLVQISDGVADALDPDAALSRAMDVYNADSAEHLRDGIRLQSVANSLMSVYRPAVAREFDEVATEYLTDPRRKERVRVELSDALRFTCDSMHPGPMPPMSVLDGSLRHDADIIGKGVRVRDMYPLSVLQSAKYVRYLQDLAGLGAEVRLVDHAPFDALIFDGHTVAIAPDRQNPSQSMLVIRGAVLVGTYVELYEDYWLRAIPLAEATGSGLEDKEFSPQERVIIRLMAAGLSDDQIARKLGVSRRTVQRSVARLMERLGAASRFEAGLRLAREPLFRLPIPAQRTTAER
ncbi:LuxR C-terminal-related transcriptional regulator [Streptomyces sp. CA-111067]|uniref:helix-turn-helix transcriptional regulator n=1 Tax=Streptomyces sp. CA-111067 TaxID=3240046 RepID=UPI003D9992C5